MDSTKITCIAVDDEPAALRIIESFANKTDQLNLVKTFRNPIDAITFLNSSPVQLIFLDINMPDLSGIDFIKSLTDPPLIILTTAYSEYALESYDYGILDYLQKPIPFPRFLKAVYKASMKKQNTSVINRHEPEIITLKDAGTIYAVHPQEIQYLESLGNYVKVYTKDETIIINSGLQKFLDIYRIKHLIRIHKSYVVNVRNIRKLTYSSLNIEEKELPIGRKYREEIKKIFKDF